MAWLSKLLLMYFIFKSKVNIKGAEAYRPIIYCEIYNFFIHVIFMYLV